MCYWIVLSSIHVIFHAKHRTGFIVRLNYLITLCSHFLGVVVHSSNLKQNLCFRSSKVNLRNLLVPNRHITVSIEVRCLLIDPSAQAIEQFLMGFSSFRSSIFIVIQIVNVRFLLNHSLVYSTWTTEGDGVQVYYLDLLWMFGALRITSCNYFWNFTVFFKNYHFIWTIIL